MSFYFLRGGYAHFSPAALLLFTLTGRLDLFLGGQRKISPIRLYFLKNAEIVTRWAAIIAIDQQSSSGEKHVRQRRRVGEICLHSPMSRYKSLKLSP